MFDIDYNGKSSRELVRIPERPDFPAPKKRILERAAAAGRDGDYIITDGAYEDIQLTVEMVFITPRNQWGEHYRKIKRWLLDSDDNKLTLSDDQLVYYRVKHVEISDTEREIRIGGELKAVFTLDPYTYYKSGLETYLPDKIKYNEFYTSKPVYMITGDGACTLTVNENAVKANVGQNLTIDTERMIAYRDDGGLMNTSITGDYESLYLKTGENNISITDGFNLRIIPNWRTI